MSILSYKTGATVLIFTTTLLTADRVPISLDRRT